jgi:hypothetical protein
MRTTKIDSCESVHQNDRWIDKLIESSSDQPARVDASLSASVRIGALQSIPSHSIDNCAGVSTAAPSCVSGHTNRPRSSRFA